MRKIVALLICLMSLSACGVQSIPMQKNEVEAAWSEVINQYKRRSDLIPNLVETVKAFAQQERETFTAVTEARAKATQFNVQLDDLSAENMQKLQELQGAVGSALSRLMAVSERYPNLKSNQNFRDLQVQLEGTENRIATARRRYIETVKQFNNLVTVFPTNITNNLFFHFEKLPQFTVENEGQVQETPQVNF